eukprot:Awhi_evm1s1857
MLLEKKVEGLEEAAASSTNNANRRDNNMPVLIKAPQHGRGATRMTSKDWMEAAMQQKDEKEQKLKEKEERRIQAEKKKLDKLIEAIHSTKRECPSMCLPDENSFYYCKQHIRQSREKKNEIANGLNNANTLSIPNTNTNSELPTVK